MPAPSTDPQDKPRLRVINLAPRESECILCGRPLVECRQGVAMYEGSLVPHDWTGDWAGHDACDACFERHERGELPTWPEPPGVKRWQQEDDLESASARAYYRELREAGYSESSAFMSARLAETALSRRRGRGRLSRTSF